jgi:hypothetical protein
MYTWLWLSDDSDGASHFVSPLAAILLTWIWCTTGKLRSSEEEQSGLCAATSTRSTLNLLPITACADSYCRSKRPGAYLVPDSSTQMLVVDLILGLALDSCPRSSVLRGVSPM